MRKRWMIELVIILIVFDCFYVSAVSLPTCSDAGFSEWKRGDANNDGKIQITDAVYTLSWLFQGGKAVKCLELGDVNGNGNVEISDAIYTLNYLFRGGTPPVFPADSSEAGSSTFVSDEPLKIAFSYLDYPDSGIPEVDVVMPVKISVDATRGMLRDCIIEYAPLDNPELKKEVINSGVGIDLMHNPSYYFEFVFGAPETSIPEGDYLVTATCEDANPGPDREDTVSTQVIVHAKEYVGDVEQLSFDTSEMVPLQAPPISQTPKGCCPVFCQVYIPGRDPEGKKDPNSIAFTTWQTCEQTREKDCIKTPGGGNADAVDWTGKGYVDTSPKALCERVFNPDPREGKVEVKSTSLGTWKADSFCSVTLERPVCIPVSKGASPDCKVKDMTIYRKPEDKGKLKNFNLEQGYMTEAEIDSKNRRAEFPGFKIPVAKDQYHNNNIPLGLVEGWLYGTIPIQRVPVIGTLGGVIMISGMYNFGYGFVVDAQVRGGADKCLKGQLYKATGTHDEFKITEVNGILQFGSTQPSYTTSPYDYVIYPYKEVRDKKSIRELNRHTSAGEYSLFKLGNVDETEIELIKKQIPYFIPAWYEGDVVDDDDCAQDFRTQIGNRGAQYDYIKSVPDGDITHLYWHDRPGTNIPMQEFAKKIIPPPKQRPDIFLSPETPYSLSNKAFLFDIVEDSNPTLIEIPPVPGQTSGAEYREYLGRWVCELDIQMHSTGSAPKRFDLIRPVECKCYPQYKDSWRGDWIRPTPTGPYAGLSVNTAGQVEVAC